MMLSLPKSIFGRFNRSAVVAICALGLFAQSLFTQALLGADVKSHFIGTNFWFLAPGWSGEQPFKDEIPANPYTNDFDIWNPVFIEEISFYSCLRFMDWGATNNYTGTSWSNRRLPDDPEHFVSIPVGTRDVPAWPMSG